MVILGIIRTRFQKLKSWLSISVPYFRQECSHSYDDVTYTGTLNRTCDNTPCQVYTKIIKINFNKCMRYLIIYLYFQSKNSLTYTCTWFIRYENMKFSIFWNGLLCFIGGGIIYLEGGASSQISLIPYFFVIKFYLIFIKTYVENLTLL